LLVVANALKSTDLPRGAIATIGNYDGVHRGQRAILELVVARARAAGAPSMVVTFEPHPLSILRPEQAPMRVTTQAQKERLLDALGIDVVAVVRFTPELAQMPARRFVRDVLHERLQLKEIYVGSRFVFGHQREGDLSLLREMGKTFDFEAFGVEEVLHRGEPASSTRIRRAIQDGGVEDAWELLGRTYAIEGLIARGDRMGKRLGWPTINVVPDHELLPADGVYASRVYFPSFPATFDCVTNIGTRPTMYENYQRVVESHILGFHSDVYGERVELHFLKRLRDERVFPSVMDLSEQIGRDVEATREYFQARRRLEESIEDAELRRPETKET
jgi:riboflavin kinase/FMN adenylyltransferase